MLRTPFVRACAVAIGLTPIFTGSSDAGQKQAAYDIAQAGITFTLHNQYQGVTQYVTSETWGYNRTPCIHEEFDKWFKAATTVARTEMNDYRDAYSNLTVDVDIYGPNGSVSHKGLTLDELSGLSMIGMPGGSSELYEQGEDFIRNANCFIA